MKSIQITCTACQGTGQRELCAEYAQTLDALDKLKRATYGQIKDRMKADGLLEGTFDETIIHKRVARLCSMGLVRRVGQKRPKKHEDQRRRAWLFERV